MLVSLSGLLAASVLLGPGCWCKYALVSTKGENGVKKDYLVQIKSSESVDVNEHYNRDGSFTNSDLHKEKPHLTRSWDYLETSIDKHGNKKNWKNNVVIKEDVTKRSLDKKVQRFPQISQPQTRSWDYIETSTDQHGNKRKWNYVNIHGGKKESSMNTDTKNIKGSFRNQQKDYLPQTRSWDYLETSTDTRGNTKNWITKVTHKLSPKYQSTQPSGLTNKNNRNLYKPSAKNNKRVTGIKIDDSKNSFKWDYLVFTDKENDDEQQKPTEKGQKQKNIDAVEQHMIKGKETNPGETMGEEEYGTDYTDDNIVFAPQNNVKTPDEAFSSLKKFETVEERIATDEMKVSEGEEKYAMKAKIEEEKIESKESKADLVTEKHHDGENGKADGDKKEKTEAKHIEKVRDDKGSDYVGRDDGTDGHMDKDIIGTYTTELALVNGRNTKSNGESKDPNKSMINKTNQSTDFNLLPNNNILRDDALQNITANHNEQTYKTLNQDVLHNKSSNQEGLHKTTSNHDALHNKTTNHDELDNKTTNPDAQHNKTTNHDELDNKTTNPNAQHNKTTNHDELDNKTTNPDSQHNKTTNHDEVDNKTTNPDAQHEELHNKTSTHDDLNDKTSIQDKLHNKTSTHNALHNTTTTHDELHNKTSTHDELYNKTTTHDELYNKTSTHDELHNKTLTHDELHILHNVVKPMNIPLTTTRTNTTATNITKHTVDEQNFLNATDIPAPVVENKVHGMHKTNLDPEPVTEKKAQVDFTAQYDSNEVGYDYMN